MATRKSIGTIVLLAAVLLMAGCNAAPAVVPTQAPTPDLGAVKTEAAQTVVAAITAEALLNPSATPTAFPTATEMPAPTSTPAPTLTPLATATRVTSGGGGGGGGGGGVITRPSATPYSDRAVWVSQSLKDGITLQPGQDFDMVWTVKNTGVRAWTTDFYYAYQSGDLEPVKGDVRYLESEVDKGDTVDMRVDFIAPSQPGRYTSNWALINDDGVAFFHFYIVINVQ